MAAEVAKVGSAVADELRREFDNHLTREKVMKFTFTP